MTRTTEPWGIVLSEAVCVCMLDLGLEDEILDPGQPATLYLYCTVYMHYESDCDGTGPADYEPASVYILCNTDSADIAADSDV